MYTHNYALKCTIKYITDAYISKSFLKKFYFFSLLDIRMTRNNIHFNSNNKKKLTLTTKIKKYLIYINIDVTEILESERESYDAKKII